VWGEVAKNKITEKGSPNSARARLPAVSRRRHQAKRGSAKEEKGTTDSISDLRKGGYPKGTTCQFLGKVDDSGGILKLEQRKRGGRED